MTEPQTLRAALEQIRDGLVNTGSLTGEWMTKITKKQAFEIALVALTRKDFAGAEIDPLV